MTIDPTTIIPLNHVTNETLDTDITTHGVVETTGQTPRLVEVNEDYSGPRLPVSLALVDTDDLEHGSYVLISGTLETDSDFPSFGSVTLSVDTKTEYAPELDSHASETSPTKAYNIIDDILSEFSDPIPVRYVIETAIERGVTRETAADVLSRMESAGNIYSPDPGLLAGM